MRRARNAKIAHRRLSPAFGVVHPRGFNKLVPAEMTRLRPAPTWIPFTTGVGITCVNHLRSPVMLNMNTTPAVMNPAETVSSTENFLAIATAAMACIYQLICSGREIYRDVGVRTFMGCTGRGIPKNTPVSIFHRPEKTRVVERDIELLTANAIISGRRVPRSPREPEISVRGEFRNVLTLLAWRFRILVRVAVKAMVGQKSSGCPVLLRNLV